MSTSITFTSFVLISLYHGSWQLMSLKRVREMKSKIAIMIIEIRQHKKDHVGCDHAESSRSTINQLQSFTHTSVELCESLISHDENHEIN